MADWKTPTHRTMRLCDEWGTAFLPLITMKL